MVLSQTSNLGKLAGLTRRVTLITDPTYSTSTGSWLVNGLDADKQQVQIDLTALPPGVTKDLIKAGQQWFVERQTTYNRLSLFVGELDVSTVDFQNPGDLLVGSGLAIASVLPLGSNNTLLGVENNSLVYVSIPTISGLPLTGISQTTGDILASGIGSVTATLQSTPNVEDIITNNSTVSDLGTTVSGLWVTVSGLVVTVSGLGSTVSGLETTVSGIITSLSGYVPTTTLSGYVQKSATPSGDLAGPGSTYAVPILTYVGTSGTYGSSTVVPVITTDNKGRVTSVSGANIVQPAMVLIASKVLTSGLPSVTFSGIPQTYNHLKLMCNAISNYGASSDSFMVQLNNDTATHYSVNGFYVNGTSLNGVNNGGISEFTVGETIDLSNNGSYPSDLDIDFLRYSQTTFYKNMSWKSSNLNNSIFVSVNGVWTSTSGISSIKIFPQEGPDFVTGSAFYLYGIT